MTKRQAKAKARQRRISTQRHFKRIQNAAKRRRERESMHGGMDL